MRKINYLVIHCSATRSDRDFPVEALRRCHVQQNHWSDIGYHFYLTKDGTIYPCRPTSKSGAHVKGHNLDSIGICYEGGLDPHGNPADTRTALQKASMAELLKKLHALYPEAKILGHRDFPGVKKACPCFDVKQWLQDIRFRI